MLCNECGNEIPNDSEFCCFCGAKIDNHSLMENKTARGAQPSSRTKCSWIRGLFIALVCFITGFFILRQAGVLPRMIKTDYTGKYWGVVVDEEDGEKEVYKVWIHDGKFTVSIAYEAYVCSGFYEYNEKRDAIELKEYISKKDNTYDLYVLEKRMGKYYLTLHEGGLGEYTIEVAPGEKSNEKEYPETTL